MTTPAAEVITPAPAATPTPAPAAAPAAPTPTPAPAAEPTPAPAPAPSPAPAAEPAKEGEQKKPVEGEPKEGDPKPEEIKPVPKAPETYEFKFADGVKVTPDVQSKIEAYARANDLSQEQAQALVDLAPDVSKMFSSQLDTTIKDVSAKWMADTKVDKEIAGGGDKTILAANMALVAKARDAFATPELMSLLNDFDRTKNPGGTGFGNHPEVVRLFLRLGKAISEDNVLVDGKETTAPQTPAQKLYSKTTKPK